MSICSDEESKVKYPELKYFKCQHGDLTKAK